MRLRINEQRKRAVSHTSLEGVTLLYESGKEGTCTVGQVDAVVGRARLLKLRSSEKGLVSLSTPLTGHAIGSNRH